MTNPYDTTAEQMLHSIRARMAEQVLFADEMLVDNDGSNKSVRMKIIVLNTINKANQMRRVVKAIDIAMIALSVPESTTPSDESVG
jgi:hypothetical protein